jgi:hypothetical protein
MKAAQNPLTKRGIGLEAGEDELNKPLRSLGSATDPGTTPKTFGSSGLFSSLSFSTPSRATARLIDLPAKQVSVSREFRLSNAGILDR